MLISIKKTKITKNTKKYIKIKKYLKNWPIKT